MSKKNKLLGCMPNTEYLHLLEVCSIQSHSSNELHMVLFLIDEITKLGLSYEIDKIGNILVTKGNINLYPCIVSHIDTVHRIVDNYKLFYRNIINKDGHIIDTKLFAGIDKKGHKPTGIGGDDKCGVYACLYFLRVLPAVKVVFFTREETGCVGSKGIDKSFFDNCRYIIQLDRRHGYDFIDKHYRGNTTSNKFRSEVGHLKKEHNFKSTTGSITDAIRLWLDEVGISCVNLSSGYYEPHSDNEYIRVRELWNSVQLAHNIIKTLKPEKYFCKPKPIVHNYVKKIYKQCFICKSWKDESAGFRPSAMSYNFVCYECWGEELDKKKEKSETKLLYPAKKEDVKITIGCSICGRYVPKSQGSYTDKESIYEGKFVCYNCNVDVKIYKGDDKNIHVTCSECGRDYVSPLCNGTYGNREGTVWTCYDCLGIEKNKKLDEQPTHTIKELDENNTLVCDLCNKPKKENEGREAHEHDFNFICYDCLYILYGEEN